MTRRRGTPARSLLGLVAVISTADARSISSFPAEIRKRNYMRLSTEKCDECITLEDFYKDNPLGFVLFYERALLSHHKYKEAIVAGWMESCKDLSFSRIACGMVDMVSDREYAARYIEPQTAPAHIVVRNSEPVMALKEQVDGLLARPGHKETMLAHVADLLREEGSLGSLMLSVQVNNKEALQRLLKRHRLVVVAFTGEERRLADSFRAAVQEAILSQRLATHVSGTPKEAVADSGRKGKGKDSNEAKEKWRIAFVVAHGKGMGARFGVPGADGTIGAFVRGALQPDAVTMKASVGGTLDDPEVLEAVKKVTEKADLEVAAQSEKKTRKGASSEL